MDITPCLQGLVGVSETACDCWEDGKPTGDDETAGITEATSGLFLDQLVDLKMIKASGDCEGKDVWALGVASIKEATARFQANVLQFWGQKDKARKPWDNFLTKDSHKGVFTPSGIYAGVVIVPRQDVKYGEIEILNVGTLFSGMSTDFNLYLYDERELRYTIPLDSAAGVYQANPLVTTLKLPFRTKGIARQAYYLFYQVTSNKPLNNEMICRNCNPGLADHMAQWATVQGITGSVIADRNKWAMSNDGNGLVPEVKIRCHAAQSICDGGMEIGQDPNAGVIAEAIWYLSAGKLCGKILNSPDINQYTLLDGDQLAKLEGKYNTVGKARMEAIANSDLGTDGGCYECVQNMRIQTPHM